ncbi:MAG: FG-GAP repeat protein [Planctomycetes bacterium]|nr:FG-GAP repeat protein [Planctomycetota bacterium]
MLAHLWKPVLALFVLAAQAFAQQTLLQAAGQQAGSHFGSSVAFIGDINFDGFDEIAVGSATEDPEPNKFNAGRVRIYSGATGALLRTHDGSAAHDTFGWAVSSAGGDVNLDGAPDYAVGAPGSDAGFLNAGQVRLFSGATGGLIASKNGEAQDDNFGWAVATGGRPFPAGLLRLLVGAPFHDAGGINSGAVYLYNANTFSLVRKVTGSQANENFGIAIAGGEDADGEGSDDFVVGAPGWDSGGFNNRGRFIVYSGASPYAAIASAVGVQVNWMLGTAVALLPDYDGDGLADVAVSTTTDGSGSEGLYLYRLNPFLDLISFTVTFGSQGYGRTLASAGDVTGDGRTDLLIGAPLTDAGGQTDVGAVHIRSHTSGAVFLFQGSAANERCGDALAGGGAVGGFSTSDFAFSLPGNDSSGTNAGKVQIHVGTTFQLFQTIVGPAVGDGFGSRIANIGDANGDGFPDLAIGAPRATKIVSPTTHIAKAGSVKLLSGATGGTLWESYGNAEGDTLGADVSFLGDLNQDGRNDVLVGVPRELLPTGAAGLAMVLSGTNGSSLFIGPLNTLSGVAPNDAFGAAVAGVGDLNLDGVPDIVGGMPRYSPLLADPQRGGYRAFSGANGNLLFQTIGAADNDQLGFALAALGDVTEDGRPDFAVGSIGESSSGFNAGRVYVISGATGLSVASMGGFGGDRFGYSLASVGDLDGDGKNDLVAGGPYHTQSGLTQAGIVRFLRLHGSPVQITSLGQRIGASAMDQYGFSVAGVGDVDGDLRGDVLVGARPTTAFPNTALGYAELISGSARDLLYRLNGNTAGGLFGASGVGVGDLTLDGIPDAAIGAPGDSHLLTDGIITGKVHVMSLQPKGVSFYGVPTNGCNGPQPLLAHGVPKVGNTLFGVATTNAPPSSLGLTIATDSQDLAGSDPFALGISLHVDFFLASEVYALDMPSDAQGRGFTALPLPNTAALVGKSYYLQSIWAWPGACAAPPYNLSASKAVQVVIQP